MAAKLLVITTRFTDGALFLMAFRIPVVPTIAKRVSEAPVNGRVMRTRIEEVFLHVSGIEVEWTCGVDHSLERRVGYDSLIKGIWQRNVLDDGKVEFVFGYIRVCGFDSLRFFSRSHRRYDGMAPL